MYCISEFYKTKSDRNNRRVIKLSWATNLCKDDCSSHFLLQIVEEFVFSGLQEVEQMMDILNVDL